MDKQAFFEATKIPVGRIEIEGFGEVAVRSLTLSERVSLVDRYKEDASAATIWVCKNGLGFADEDLPQLEQTSPEVLEQVAAEVLRLAGVGEIGDDGDDTEAASAKND